jgi:hypothetical protein
MPASQAGRRRFDPGRPLHSLVCKFEQLAAHRENREDRDGALSPTYHLNSAARSATDWIPALAASRARRLPRRGLSNLFDALGLEALFWRAHRYGADGARLWFLFGINPERFAELPAADAGARAGELEGGESTSGLEPSRAESRSRDDEATEVGGTHMAFGVHRTARSAGR